MSALQPFESAGQKAPTNLYPITVSSDFISGRLKQHHYNSLKNFIETVQFGKNYTGGAILIEPCNGKVKSIAENACAFPHRNSDFIVQWEFFSHLTPEHSPFKQQNKLLAKQRAEMKEVLTDGRYINYAHQLDRPEHWWKNNVEQLKSIATEYDPEQLLITRLNPFE